MFLPVVEDTIACLSLLSSEDSNVCLIISYPLSSEDSIKTVLFLCVNYYHLCYLLKIAMFLPAVEDTIACLSQNLIFVSCHFPPSVLWRQHLNCVICVWKVAFLLKIALSIYHCINNIIYSKPWRQVCTFVLHLFKDSMFLPVMEDPTDCMFVSAINWR